MGHRPCLGTRVLHSDGSYGSYNWLTYAQVGEVSGYFGSGLVNLGISANDHIGIYAANRKEWVVSLIGCASQSIVFIPLYDTLGPDATVYIMNHSDISIVCSSGENIPKLLNAKPESPNLSTIICFDKPTEEDVSKANQLSVTLISFEEVIDLGKSNEIPHQPPSPEDLFCIMYTSGTTGVPKGVMIAHSCLACTLSAVRHTSLQLGSDDVHLSYLPLAHIFEMNCCLTALKSGAQIGFWHGETTELIEDIQELRPTILVGVPRVWNRIYDKIQNTIASGGFVKRYMFTKAFSSKQRGIIENGTDESPLWDKLVFSKMAELLGGRCRLIISGAAPLSPQVQEFLRICFCCPVIQGYGLTETSSCGTLAENDDFSFGQVGPPIVACEIKLVDVPDMGYVSSTNPQRGEVCIRGACVFKGYYKMPEKTAEAIDQDNWFHTGDIGQWNPTGTLSIIDRKKNIFKLAQGEYVAAEYLENVFLQSRYVGQIFVYGNSFQSYLVAIIIPDEDVLAMFAQSNNLNGTYEDLCRDESIKRAIFNDLTLVAEENKLKGFEKIKNIYLDHEMWTPENELLTPTMKMKRSVIFKAYEPIIEQLYQEDRLDVSPKL
eukprot:TRINITY_DN5966_c0_g1_i1.p1 TRINITY_DN5966_c0_g1~~TRINITY_DN5966_c0_g1_i1.p1  ORF type:complete len:604 (-),score=135.99 TRINITY_DN5966_c0_g1_i1:40-1851(-)